MDYTIAIHETISGTEKRAFPASATGGGQYAARLETGGTISATLKTNDALLAAIPQPVLHELSDPDGEYSVVLKCAGTLVSAGVILDAPFDEDTGDLTMQGKDLADVFWPARMTSGVNIKDQGTLTITNRSYAGAVRAILIRATQWGATWPLPIDLPPDGAGTFSATWDWWEFRTIQELLDQVRKEGVQIHLQPYLTADRVLRYQTIVAPSISTGRVALSARVAKSPVTGLKYNRRGAKLITGAQVVGNGKGSGVLTAWAGVPVAGRPIRDSYIAAGEITEQDRLQKIATETHKANKDPLREWALSIEATDPLHPAKFLPGKVIDLSVFGSRVIPSAVHPLQVVSLSGNVTSRRVTPEVVPYAG